MFQHSPLEASFMPNSDEVNAQQALLLQYRRTLAVYSQQLAQHSSHVPPSIVHGIFEACTDIRRIKSTLLSWGIEITDEANDKYCEYEDFQDLLSAIRGSRVRRKQSGRLSPPQQLSDDQILAAEEPLKITSVIANEVTKPRNDGSRGSALYQIPFQLSRTPSWEWSKLFVEAWNRPPRFTMMHSPGIARVIGDRIILDGTTMEEVEQYHLETLKLAVAQANERLAEYEKAKQRQAEIEAQQRKQHEGDVQNVAGRLKFD
jgi:hypothetical protein